MSEVRIKFATIDDRQALTELLLVFEKSEAVMPLDMPKAVGEMLKMLREGVVILALDGEKLAGSIALIEMALWYSTKPLLFDRWCIVHPDHRQGGHVFKKLIEAAERVAQEVQAPFIPGISSPNRMRAKIRLYRRMGYRLCIAEFVQVGKAGSHERRRRQHNNDHD